MIGERGDLRRDLIAGVGLSGRWGLHLSAEPALRRGHSRCRRGQQGRRAAPGRALGRRGHRGDERGPAPGLRPGVVAGGEAKVSALTAPGGGHPGHRRGPGVIALGGVLGGVGQGVELGAVPDGAQAEGGDLPERVEIVHGEIGEAHHAQPAAGVIAGAEDQPILLQIKVEPPVALAGVALGEGPGGAGLHVGHPEAAISGEGHQLTAGGDADGLDAEVGLPDRAALLPGEIGPADLLPAPPWGLAHVEHVREGLAVDRLDVDGGLSPVGDGPAPAGGHVAVEGEALALGHGQIEGGDLPAAPGPGLLEVDELIAPREEQRGGHAQPLRVPGAADGLLSDGVAFIFELIDEQIRVRGAVMGAEQGEAAAVIGERGPLQPPAGIEGLPQPADAAALQVEQADPRSEGPLEGVAGDGADGDAGALGVEGGAQRHALLGLVEHPPLPGVEVHGQQAHALAGDGFNGDPAQEASPASRGGVAHRYRAMSRQRVISVLASAIRPSPQAATASARDHQRQRPTSS